MKRGAYDYAYNAQAAVDGESGVIVAAELTNLAPDVGHLPSLVAEVRALRTAAALPETRPTTVSADAGYFSGENAAEDGAGLDLLIAAGRDDPTAATTKATVYSIDHFGYDPTRDVWICTADTVLYLIPPTGRTGRVSMHQYVASAEDGVDCPLRAHCLKLDAEHQLLQARTVGLLVRCASSCASRTPSPLRPPQGHRRAGLRPTQGGARFHHPQPARPRSCCGRVPAGLPRSQPWQVAARLPAPARPANTCGGLILDLPTSGPPTCITRPGEALTTALHRHLTAPRPHRPARLSADCWPANVTRLTRDPYS